MRHLSDEEIQAFLDEGEGSLDSEALDHLSICNRCRRVLEDYKILFADLADGSAFEIPRDLSATVISRLGLRVHQRRRALPTDIVLVTGGILAMVIAVALFVDLGPLLNAATVAGRYVTGHLSPGMESLKDGLSNARQTTGMLILGGAILVVIGALDLLLGRSRGHPAVHLIP